MPRLPEYDAPSRELTPSDKGASAFEQAGRRIGPAYNEAATLTRERGAVASDLIKQRRWPFDMLELERSLDTLNEVKQRQTGAVGTRIEGGVNNMVGGMGTQDFGDRSEGRGHKSRTGADVGGMSIAAAGLGRMAAAMAKGNQYRNSEIDPGSGLDLMDPRNQSKGYTALEGGRLVHYDRNGSRLDATPKDQFSGPNAGAERSAQGSTQWTSGIDWTNPKNQAKREAEYQRTGVDPVTGSMDGTTGQSPGWSFGASGLDNQGNPVLPPSQDYGGGADTVAQPGFQPIGNPFDPAPESSQPQNPFGQLSPSGAADAKGAVDWMKGQYGDQSGAGTDALSPSGGGTDDTTYDNGSGDYGSGAQ